MGVILIITEIYFMPGTFIFGGLGLLLIIISLILSMQTFNIPDPNLPWEKDIFIKNSILVLGVALISLIIPVLGAKYLIPHLPGQMKMILDETMKDAHTTSIEQSHPEIHIGCTGTTKSMLRPSGKIEINNRRYDASAISGFIEKETPIEIVSVQGNKITVREIS